MKTVLDVLHKVKEILKDKDEYETMFICNIVKHNMSISNKLRDGFFEFFLTQRPTKILHANFFNDKDYFKFSKGYFIDGSWWNFKLKTTRIKFIDKLIEEYSKVTLIYAEDGEEFQTYFDEKDNQIKCGNVIGCEIGNEFHLMCGYYH